LWPPAQLSQPSRALLPSTLSGSIPISTLQSTRTRLRLPAKRHPQGLIDTSVVIEIERVDA
jgi:hypothetical protein